MNGSTPLRSIHTAVAADLLGLTDGHCGAWMNSAIASSGPSCGALLIAESERVLGDTHSSTLASHNNLATRLPGGWALAQREQPKSRGRPPHLPLPLSFRKYEPDCLVFQRWLRSGGGLIAAS